MSNTPVSTHHSPYVQTSWAQGTWWFELNIVASNENFSTLAKNNRTHRIGWLAVIKKYYARHDDKCVASIAEILAIFQINLKLSDIQRHNSENCFSINSLKWNRALAEKRNQILEGLRHPIRAQFPDYIRAAPEFSANFLSAALHLNARIRNDIHQEEHKYIHSIYIFATKGAQHIYIYRTNPKLIYLAQKLACFRATTRGETRIANLMKYLCFGRGKVIFQLPTAK